MGFKAQAEQHLVDKEAAGIRACKAVTIANSLPEGADRDYYLQVVLPADPTTFSGSEIVGLLRGENLQIAASTITTHRSRSCGCSW